MNPSNVAGASGRSATTAPPALWLLVGAAAAVIVALGMQALAWLIGPVLLALVVVITVRPVAGWLRAKGVPRWAAAVVLIVLVYAVVLVLAGVIVASIARLITVLPGYRGELNGVLGSLFGTLRGYGVGPVPLGELLGALDLGRLLGLLGGVLAGVAGLAGNLVFLFSVMLFLSIESGGFGAKLAVLDRARPAAATALVRFVYGTTRFLVVTTVFGLVTAVVDTAILLVLAVPLALLWGLLAFITNYIPYIGFFIGVVPPALLALLEGGPGLALLVVVIYIVVNFVLCSLVQPRFVGDAVGLSLTVVFLSLGFWAWVLGPLGAVLAVPLTLLVKALLVDAHPPAAWVGDLLAARPAPANDIASTVAPDSTGRLATPPSGGSAGDHDPSSSPGQS